MLKANWFFKLVAILGGIILVILVIVLNNDKADCYSMNELRNNYKLRKVNGVIDTVYRNPKDHMRLTVFFENGERFVLSPFILNIEELEGKMKSGDSLDKPKNSLYMYIHNLNGGIETTKIELKPCNLD